jgi:hypothetical protein
MIRQTVMFDGQDASDTYGLWLTNGTRAGTDELTGISGANSGGLSPWPPYQFLERRGVLSRK